MQNALVVVVDDLLGVIHTAVTDFDRFAVKYLAEFVSYVVADVLAEWRVAQENVVSLSVFAFDKAAPPYQKALDEGGYQYTLRYEPTTTAKRKNRQRNNIQQERQRQHRTQIPQPN